MRTRVCSFCGSWDNCEWCDEAHQADMRALRREELRSLEVDDDDPVLAMERLLESRGIPT